MFLTFYSKNQNITSISFEELMKDPFAKPIKTNPTISKVTIKIDHDYGLKLYNKNKSKFEFPTHIHDSIMDLKIEDHYKHFEIPKKSDPSKKRPIDAPDPLLKNYQSIFKTFIEDILHVLPHNAAHAYVENRSTVTAMQKHYDNESKWFLQIDLKNFFNSITEEFLNRMLYEVYPFRYIDINIYKEMVHLAFLNNELPQGSVLSPTLTNLIMVPIDYQITNLLTNLNKHHYVYTRYADDITISCKQKFDPKEIIAIIESVFNFYNVPFHINNDKTRFGNTSGRNYHLGIIINNHGKDKRGQLSIGHEKNKKFRAMLFNFCTTGQEWEKESVQRMLGLISYYRSIERPFIDKTIAKYNEKFNMDIIRTAKEMIK